MEWMMEISVYLITGALAGLLAGLLGIGGGLLIVPILTTAFLFFLDTPYIVHIAIATSLATILVTGLSSVLTHHAKGYVRWDIWRSMLVGLMLGGLLGAWFSQYFSTSLLATLFAILEFVIGLHMILGKQPCPHRELPGRWALNGAGVGIGSLSALLGVGGGALSTPYYLWHNVSMHQAIATSASIGLPVALAGSIGFILAGLNYDDLPAYTTGFIYWPAFIGIGMVSVITAYFGAKLAHKLPVKALKRLFGFLLIALAIKMLFY
jgi:uncharacterized membrane protein YfcA